MAPDNRPKYSMAIVRKKTGLTDRQIRYYEQVGLITPARTRGRQRIFTNEEVERLQEIKNWIEEGLTVEGVKEELVAREDKQEVTSLKTQSAQRGLAAKHRLTSLYPVSNRAQLVQMIVQRRREREREQAKDDTNTKI